MVGTVHISAAEAASRVLVMDRDGHVHARVDPALPPASGRCRPSPASARGRRAAARRLRAARERTVRSELKRLLAAGEIDAATQARYRRAFDEAIRTAPPAERHAPQRAAGGDRRTCTTSPRAGS